jgi:hypothetical protein
MPASTYNAGGVVSSPPTFDQIFNFGSTILHFGLDLYTQDPLSLNGVVVALLPGSGDFTGTAYTNLSGSAEICGFACGGPADNDGRLIVSGSLDVSEPATMTLLAAGALLPLLRRTRSRPGGGTA